MVLTLRCMLMLCYHHVMSEPHTTPVFDYPDDKPSRKGRFAALVALALAALIIVGVTLVVVTKKDAPTDPAALDYCAATEEGSMLRAKLVYTDTRFLSTEPEQVNDDENGRWCVFGPNYDTALWWAAVYVGEDNGLYRTMLAENGDDDNATRAVITFQGVPAVKFAREGWVGFVAQDEDSEQWTAFRTGAGAMLLSDIAKAADGHTRGDK